MFKPLDFEIDTETKEAPVYLLRINKRILQNIP